MSHARQHRNTMHRVVNGFEFGVLLSAVRGGVTWDIGALTASGNRREDNESKASDWGFVVLALKA